MADGPTTGNWDLLLETAMTNCKRLAAPRKADAARGFTLIEVMVSMVVLTVGLISLLGVLGLAMKATQGSEQLGVSKQLANEALESILTARETSNVQWSQIQNTGSGGIFLAGANPIYNAGVDGIIDTADDAASGIQTLDLPGPDGIFGTADDVFLPLNNYTRQVDIEPVTSGGQPDGNLRSITITVTYTTPQFKIPQTYVLSTYISPYR
jgi:prepilin-type N-terminal cleavage/methylation domain-containing protein